MEKALGVHMEAELRRLLWTAAFKPRAFALLLPAELTEAVP